MRSQTTEGFFRPVSWGVFDGNYTGRCVSCYNRIRKGDRAILGHWDKTKQGWFCSVECYKRRFEEFIQFYLLGGKEESERFWLLRELAHIEKHEQIWPEAKETFESQRKLIQARLEELSA